MTDDEMLALMRENGYLCPRKESDGSWTAIMPLAFTHAIITGINKWGYDDRWCYKTYMMARDALEDWDGADGTEPEGWHRHPPTGRRVNEETGEKYVNF